MNGINFKKLFLSSTLSGLVLGFSLYACGGGGQQSSGDDADRTTQTGTPGMSGSTSTSTGTTDPYNMGSTTGTMPSGETR
jgi:hypothetical protein